MKGQLQRVSPSGYRKTWEANWYIGLVIMTKRSEGDSSATVFAVGAILENMKNNNIIPMIIIIKKFTTSIIYEININN